MADNRAMLGVFKRAGFDVRRESAFGEVTVSLDIRPSEAVRARIAERDHRGAVASLRPILAPASVAVVGARGRTLGGAVLANLVDGGFRGRRHARRPGRRRRALDARRAQPRRARPGGRARGHRRAAAARCSAVAREAAEHGARALLVLSTGFADAGAEGRAREQELLEIVRSAGLRMVGPNCLGVLNTDPAVRLNATFAGARVPAGRLAISSQSGAIGIALLGHAAARRLGISAFASLGNRADVSTNDLLELWEEDERTAAVVLYLETFGNPDRFARIAQRVSRRKPILAVKGRRAAGAARSDAGSHAAAGLRGEAVVDALLRQAGVLRFHSGEELFDAAEFFEAQPLPRGRRVGIVEQLGRHGHARRRRLRGARPRRGGRGRTCVVLGIHAGPEAYAAGVGARLAAPGVDALLVSYVDLSGGDPPAVLRAVTAAAGGQDKPVVASVVGADGRLPPSAPGDVPNFLFPEACAGVLARAAQRRAWLSRPLGQHPRYGDVDPEAARALAGRRLADGGGWLSAADGRGARGHARHRRRGVVAVRRRRAGGRRRRGERTARSR